MRHSLTCANSSPIEDYSNLYEDIARIGRYKSDDCVAITVFPASVQNSGLPG